MASASSRITASAWLSALRAIHWLLENSTAVRASDQLSTEAFFTMVRLLEVTILHSAPGTTTSTSNVPSRLSVKVTPVISVSAATAASRAVIISTAVAVPSEVIATLTPLIVTLYSVLLATTATLPSTPLICLRPITIEAGTSS